jgi:antitoxin component HigA of HigAB toxin-antitoxin module
VERYELCFRGSPKQDGHQTIKSERQYRRALKEIEGFMAAKRTTPEGDRLDVLVTRVEAWEATELDESACRRG